MGKKARFKKEKKQQMEITPGTPVDSNGNAEEAATTEDILQSTDVVSQTPVDILHATEDVLQTSVDTSQASDDVPLPPIDASHVAEEVTQPPVEVKVSHGMLPTASQTYDIGIPDDVAYGTESDTTVKNTVQPEPIKEVLQITGVMSEDLKRAYQLIKSTGSVELEKIFVDTVSKMNPYCIQELYGPGGLTEATGIETEALDRCEGTSEQEDFSDAQQAKIREQSTQISDNTVEEKSFELPIGDIPEYSDKKPYISSNSRLENSEIIPNDAAYEEVEKLIGSIDTSKRKAGELLMLATDYKGVLPENTCYEFGHGGINMESCEPVRFNGNEGDSDINDDHSISKHETIESTGAVPCTHDEHSEMHGRKSARYGIVGTGKGNDDSTLERFSQIEGTLVGVSDAMKAIVDSIGAMNQKIEYISTTKNIITEPQKASIESEDVKSESVPILTDRSNQKTDTIAKQKGKLSMIAGFIVAVLFTSVLSISAVSYVLTGSLLGIFSGGNSKETSTIIGKDGKKLEIINQPVVRMGNKMTISNAMFLGDPKVPQWLADIGDFHMVLVVKGAPEGISPASMDEFFKKASGKFILKSPGNPDVKVGSISGNYSTGQGDPNPMYAFRITFSDEEHKKLVKGAVYTITPVDNTLEYQWEFDGAITATMY